MKVAEIGEIIADRYELVGLLGEGGMGAVFEAKQVKLERPVAIKLMHAQYGMDADARARFEREAKVSAALHHPHAVKIFDFGEDDGRLYLVMEKLVGKSLSALVNPTLPPLPHGRTVSIVRQLGEVLVAAHGMGLVHRDLKPDNIFLEVGPGGGDRVVVVDFGLAFIAEREGTERMTQQGMIMGTPVYMSPEQCSAAHVGPPTDIYATGCMLYEMVVSRPPFEGASMMLLSQHVFQPPVPPSQRDGNRYVPRALENLILAMLAKKPDDRPTAENLVAVLSQLEHTLGERERARGVEHLEGRVSRMIPTVGGRVDETLDGPAALQPTENLRVKAPAAPTDATVLAIVGSLDPSVDLGLRANGYAPTAAVASAIPPEAVAVYAPNADVGLLKELVASGALVIADTDASHMDRVSALLGIGVADVVTRPVKVTQLAKKLKRVLRRAKRRSKE